MCRGFLSSCKIFVQLFIRKLPAEPGVPPEQKRHQNDQPAGEEKQEAGCAWTCAAWRVWRGIPRPASKVAEENLGEPTCFDPRELYQKHRMADDHHGDCAAEHCLPQSPAQLGLGVLLHYISIQHAVLLQVVRDCVLRQKRRFQLDFGADPFTLCMRQTRRRVCILRSNRISARKRRSGSHRTGGDFARLRLLQCRRHRFSVLRSP